MSDATWEPSTNLQNAKEVVQDSHHDSYRVQRTRGLRMTRPKNDPVTERGRRLAERLQRREAFQQVAVEIRQDRFFPRVLLRVAEEALQLQNQQFSDKASSLSSLQEAESILQTLAEGDGDSEAFSALELE